MARTSMRRAGALLAIAASAACGGDGPDCVPIVHEPIAIRFPLFAPGAALPFADASLRQEFVEYATAGCPGPQVSTFLRFEPNVPAAVQFGYRLDYGSAQASWFYLGEARLGGTLVPTNEVLVSREPDPITNGAFALGFTYFTPL